MKQKRHSGEESIKKLRTIGEELAAGKRVEEAVQGQSISLATYQRWKSEYGGMETDALKRLKELERRTPD